MVLGFPKERTTKEEHSRETAGPNSSSIAGLGIKRKGRGRAADCDGTGKKKRLID